MSDNNKKKSFYTSVESKGQNILLRGYEDGQPVAHKIKYKPYIFVPDKEGDWKSFEGRTGAKSIPLAKKTFATIPDCREYIKEYSGISNMKMFGCDNFVRQYISSNYKGKIEWDFDVVRKFLFDIETEVTDGFPEPAEAKERILLVTIADRDKGPDGRHKVICWSWKEANRDLALKDIDETKFDVEIRVLKDEVAMLKDLLLWWKNQRMDVIGGWNSETFDVTYLVNRMIGVLGEAAAQYLSPWREYRPRTVIVNNKEKPTYDLSGLVHLDLLALYKKFEPGSQESWKLEYIAQQELGKGKAENPYESFRDFYTLAWDQFVNYNIIDVLLLIELDEKKGMLKLAMQLAYVAKCNYDDITSAMRLWESIIHNYFEEQKVAEVLGKQKNSRKDIVGAYVHAPRPGRYTWAVSVDATSLYPSIMMQNNISPECIVGMKEGWSVVNGIPAMLAGEFEIEDGFCLSPNGLITRMDELGFIPILIKRFFDQRKITKKLMLELKKQGRPESEVNALDVEQLAYKIAMNSFYGITALPYFKYYDPRLGEAVTATGQLVIQSAMKHLNEIMNKIMQTKGVVYAFYGDTDSMYFSMEKFVEKYCKGKTDQEIVTYLEKFVFDILQPELNKRLQKLVFSFGAKECRIDFKLECIGPNLIMVAKKKYAFDILYAEGVRYQEPKMKVMGIEIVRSSTPGAVKDYLKKSLELTLRSDEKSVQSYIREVKEEFLKKTMKDVACPTGVNGLDTYSDDASIYGKGTPLHVRAALLYNHHLTRLGLDKKYPLIGEGDKIKYVMLKLPNTIHENVIAFPASMPKEFDLEKYFDVKTQYEKVYLNPIQKILDAVGWSWEERINLEEFFG